MKIKKTLAKSEICVYNVNINQKGIKTAVEKIQKESPLSGQEGGITMEIKVLGKELKVTEAINDYVERKLERIDKYFETASAEVTIRAEKNEQIAEVTVSANGESYRAEAEEKDLYASIDKVIDILEGQIRKTKTKKEKMMREGSLKDMNQTSSEKHEINNEILKYGYYEIKPLAPEDAMIKLQERPTHNFLPFINIETNKVCVIYKLKDGKNYGIVEPEA